MSNLNPIPDPSSSYSTQNARSEIPNAVVVLAGFRFRVFSVEVSLNAHGALDTASASLSIRANPDLSKLFQSNINEGAVPAQIYIGHTTELNQTSTDVSQLQLVFKGIVDTLDPVFEKDEVSVTMRSNGALLYLTKQVNTSLGELTTDFVKAAASAVGLTTNIQLPKGHTPYHLAEVYGDDFMVGIHNVRLFDTIIKCAPFDDADVWVDGSVLNYVNPDLIKRNTVQLRWGHDIKAFSGKHSPQFNKNIRVRLITYKRMVSLSTTVHTEYDADGNITQTATQRETDTQALFGTNGSLRETTSTNSSGNTSVSSTQTSRTGGLFNTGATSIPSDSSAEVYDEFLPGLNQNQANDYCRKLALQISRNEFAATFTIVPTPSVFKQLNITNLFQVYSMPYSGWNTSPKYPNYYPRRMTIRFSRAQGSGNSDGLTVEVEAVNHRIAQSGV